MDTAYDHIQEELLPADEEAKADKKDSEPSSLNNEIQDAYKAISNSPWATRLGGILGNVKKQGEHYYEGARQEYNQASEQAAKGFSSIVSRTRALSLNQSPSSSAAAAPNDEQQAAPQASSTSETGEAAERPEYLPADIVREAESMLYKFKSEATKRLKDIEKAEDAADEALYKFGTNVRNFLRDAVTVVPPSGNSSTDDLLNNNPSSTVIFESKDAEGKRVLHTTRFDAQLHAVHSNVDTFLKDPDSTEFADWAAEFDVEKQTETIAKDLEKYEELKQAMERLVPEKVEYGQFWKRYYFLRHVVETDEKRRKELLKGATMAATEEEEISWDNDSSSDDGDNDNNKPLNLSSNTPTSSSQPNQQTKNMNPSTSSSSSTTINTPTPAPAPTPTPTSSSTQPQPNQEIDDNDSSNDKNADNILLKPAEANRKHISSSNTSSLSSSSTMTATTTTTATASNDQNSQADSDASYDLVSGTTSRATESPGEEKSKRDGTVAGVGAGMGAGQQTTTAAGTAGTAGTTTTTTAAGAGTGAGAGEDSDDDWE